MSISGLWDGDVGSGVVLWDSDVNVGCGVVGQ